MHFSVIEFGTYQLLSVMTRLTNSIKLLLLKCLFIISSVWILSGVQHWQQRSNKANNHRISNIHFFTEGAGGGLSRNREIRSLSRADDIVKEANDILMDILQPLIGQYKTSILFGIMDYVNKGDAAIQIGQYNILQKLNISISFGCKIYPVFCSKKEMRQAVHIAGKFQPSDLVILSSGGGHFGLYEKHDKMRLRILDSFPENKFVLLSASGSTDNQVNYDYITSEYPKRKATFMFRDISMYETVSRDIGSTNIKTILAPDMAFAIGRIPRFMLPIYDIVWMTRSQTEGANPGSSIGKIHNVFEKNGKHLIFFNKIDFMMFLILSIFSFIIHYYHHYKIF